MGCKDKMSVLAIFLHLTITLNTCTGYFAVTTNQLTLRLFPVLLYMKYIKLRLWKLTVGRMSSRERCPWDTRTQYRGS